MIEEMENHFLDNTDVEPAGWYPFSLDLAKRSIHNQNILWAMVFGSGHYTEREEALEYLSLHREESPEFPLIPFLAAIWERMTIDYIQKVMEGVRRLTQLGSKSDGLEEIRRLARHSQGWKSPIRFVWDPARVIGEYSRCPRLIWKQDERSTADRCLKY